MKKRVYLINLKQQVSNRISQKAGRVYRLTIDALDQHLMDYRDDSIKFLYIVVVDEIINATTIEQKLEGLNYLIISSSDEKIEDVCVDAIDRFWSEE